MSQINGGDELFEKEKEITSIDYYFDSYAHFGIHEEMLKDTIRTETYRKAILQNEHLFHGKIVLDVGSGTGILSMFAAKAGAGHVYSIECSDIADQAKLIIEENGLQDKITVIKGKMEEITLPVEKVDIIISEWMGYFLLFESMLDTVIFARDKYLKPDGIILPDKSLLYIAGIEDADYKEDKINFWDNVYGFKMSAIKELAYIEPLVDTVEDRAIVTNYVQILDVDLYTCKKEDLDFTSSFSLIAKRDDFIHGFVCFFECKFTRLHRPLTISTSPFHKYTHWKQTVFYTRETVTINENESLDGTISVKRNDKNPRDIDIQLAYNFNSFTRSKTENLKFLLR